jgi:type II secretory pathway component PulJ
VSLLVIDTDLMVDLQRRHPKSVALLEELEEVRRRILRITRDLRRVLYKQAPAVMTSLLSVPASRSGRFRWAAYRSMT